MCIFIHTSFVISYHSHLRLHTVYKCRDWNFFRIADGDFPYLFIKLINRLNINTGITAHFFGKQRYNNKISIDLRAWISRLSRSTVFIPHYIVDGKQIFSARTCRSITIGIGGVRSFRFSFISVNDFMNFALICEFFDCYNMNSNQRRRHRSGFIRFKLGSSEPILPSNDQSETSREWTKLVVTISVAY